MKEKERGRRGGEMGGGEGEMEGERVRGREGEREAGRRSEREGGGEREGGREVFREGCLETIFITFITSLSRRSLISILVCRQVVLPAIGQAPPCPGSFVPCNLTHTC